MITRIALLSGTASILMLGSAPASAQSPGAPPAPEPAPPAAEPVPETAVTQGEGDIVITARRRNENLQDVPLAVAVIGGAQLEATGSTNVLRLTQIQPSLQFYSTNPCNSAANIRGLGARRALPTRARGRDDRNGRQSAQPAGHAWWIQPGELRHFGPVAARRVALGGNARR